MILITIEVFIERVRHVIRSTLWCKAASHIALNKRRVGNNFCFLHATLFQLLTYLHWALLSSHSGSITPTLFLSRSHTTLTLDLKRSTSASDNLNRWCRAKVGQCKQGWVEGHICKCLTTRVYILFTAKLQQLCRFCTLTQPKYVDLAHLDRTLEPLRRAGHSNWKIQTWKTVAFLIHLCFRSLWRCEVSPS